jgi:hypothetical protein
MGMKRGFDYWERKLRLWYILHQSKESLLMNCHRCPLSSSKTDCPKDALKVNMNLKIINGIVDAEDILHGYSGEMEHGHYYGSIFKQKWFCVEWIKYE